MALLALFAVQAGAKGGAEVRDDRWSLWPLAGGIVSDADDFDRGWTAGFKATRPFSDHFVFSGGLDYSSLKTNSAGDYNRISLRGGAEAFFGRPYYDSAGSLQPFLGLGAQVSNIDFLGQTRAGYGPYASAGLMQRLTSNTSLLLEARYQHDTVPAKGPLSKDTFYTWQGLAGLRIALGEKPYDRSRDSDGDGIPDALDQCAGTPAGVKVGADGCPLDADGDGVPDSLDRCPGTAPGVSVGADGCPLDADGDGVPDDRDQCPGTPRGVAVGANGCPLDSDGDGVPDGLDRCPNTPPGAAVDSSGCPTLDSDGDGVPDHLDRCPNTAPGTRVSSSGCPYDSDGDGIPDERDDCPRTPPGAVVLPTGCALKGDCRPPRSGEQADRNGCALDQKFVLRGVKFEFNSDVLTVEAREILNQVADTLRAYPNVYVEVEGHTDWIGTDAYNQGLSERRARSVKAYLIGHGIHPARMTAVGYGESRPIDTNETDQGRENNRRVELKVK